MYRIHTVVIEDLGRIQDTGISSRGSRHDTRYRIQAVNLEDLGRINV